MGCEMPRTCQAVPLDQLSMLLRELRRTCIMVSHAVPDTDR